jgi:hypothetical protein
MFIVNIAAAYVTLHKRDQGEKGTGTLTRNLSQNHQFSNCKKAKKELQMLLTINLAFSR